MRVLMVSPELSPVLAEGGIGEGVRALVDALVAIGDSVTVVLPGCPRRELPTRLDEHGELPRGASYRMGPYEGVDLVYLDHPVLASRSHLYGEDTNDVENAHRVGVFCRALVDFVIAVGSPFDVAHAHEWPCAMVPYLLREALVPLPCVFTLHNAMHQGIFFPEVLRSFGLGEKHVRIDRLEFFGRINLVKGAIVASNVLNTVSPTYRDELLTPEHGELLDGVLASRGADFSGILNGIDGAKWNPRTDRFLAAPFDADDLAGKKLCKAAAAKEHGFDPGSPLVVSIGRIIDQKGPDLLAGALPSIRAAGGVVLICGAGDAHLESQLREACREPVTRAPESPRPTGNAELLGRVSDEAVHRLIAAADYVIMPSRYEPCGIVQLYGLRYGSLPIVRRTGGLADSVRSHESPDGTGFFFDEPSVGALVDISRIALRVYETSRFAEMQRNAMRVDRGWGGPAIRYRSLYMRARDRRERQRNG